MATIAIPTRKLNAPAGGGDFVWPAGAWRGAIEDVAARALPSSAAGEPFKGYETTDGEEINLRIGSNVYLDDEEQANVAGNRKQFITLVLRDGDRSIYDVDSEVQNAPYWKLQQSQRYALAIARALGATVEDGEMTVMEEGFIDALAAGQYNGVEIGYVVSHSKPNKDGKVFANVVDFIASV